MAKKMSASWSASLVVAFEIAIRWQLFKATCAIQGAGTVPRLMQHFWPGTKMEGWELDGNILPVARQFMGLQQLEDSGDLVINAFQVHASLLHFPTDAVVLPVARQFMGLQQLEDSGDLVINAFQVHASLLHFPIDAFVLPVACQLWACSSLKILGLW